MVFLEALRQMQFEVGKENMILIHVSLVPVLGSVGEQKTKPTQHGMKELRGLGLSPDIIVCRSSHVMTESTIKKISIFCQVPTNAVVSVYDAPNIYHIPLILVNQGIHRIIKKSLNLENMTVEPDLKQWSTMALLVDNVTDSVTIAIVGKYTGLSDSYLSLLKSLIHSGIALHLKVNVEWVIATDLENAENVEAFNKAWDSLKSAKGIIIPGGFGSRGVEGKILATEYARINKVPCLGICLGMQVMVIEFARNVLNQKGANSEEFDPNTSYPTIVFMPEINPDVMGGNMRLGSRPTRIRVLDRNGNRSLAGQMYGINENLDMIFERHRHRYEVNPEKISELVNGGLEFTGVDEHHQRMEIVELRKEDHPFYFGTQFHPEFKSRPNRPSPPFFSFVAASSLRFDEIQWASKVSLE
jgi:CTP synthase